MDTEQPEKNTDLPSEPEAGTPEIGTPEAGSPEVESEPTAAEAASLATAAEAATGSAGAPVKEGLKAGERKERHKKGYAKKGGAKDAAGATGDRPAGERKPLERRPVPSLLFLYSETAFPARPTAAAAEDSNLQAAAEIDAELIHNSFAKEFGLPAFAPLDDSIAGLSGSKRTGAGNYVTGGSLLLIPARTLRGVFTWITSIERLNEFQESVKGSPCGPRWNLPAAPKETALVNPRSHCVARKHLVVEQFSYLIESSPVIFPIGAWLADNALPRGSEYQWWRKKLVNDLVILPDASFKRVAEACQPINSGSMAYARSYPPESLFYSVFDPSLWEKKFERSHIVLPSTASSTEPGIFATRLIRYAKRKKRNKRPAAKPQAGAAAAPIPAEATATAQPAGAAEKA